MSSGDPGLFGPDSSVWRIDREVLILAGGTCALLMQLAHPSVAAGVEQHSDFRGDPFGRLRRTLSATYAVAFGTRRRAQQAIDRMNAIHGVVRGRVPDSGQAYAARDPELLLWVHATLIDTALRVYHRYVAPLSEGEQEAYHRESRLIATSLGVPEDRMPHRLADLRAWMAAQLSDGPVRVTPVARRLAPAVLHPTRFPPRAVWNAGHLISFSVMPPALREGYGIAWGPGHESVMRGVAATTRRLLPLVPPVLRHVPAARAAERRAGSWSRT
ncbi:MAG TPA: oxygenase MpaB family protein [Candidatus Limnocylindria bacterium]|nr:oxygenase MpaB family protein [Candidatus Limnocylindria bacterium]